MFFLPKFTTYHDFIREQPDGTYEILEPSEVATHKPTNILLVESKCFEWFGFCFTYKETDHQVRYD